MRWCRARCWALLGAEESSREVPAQDSVVDGDGGLRCTTPAWRRGAPMSSLTWADEGLSSAPGSGVLAGFQRACEIGASGWAHPT